MPKQNGWYSFSRREKNQAYLEAVCLSTGFMAELSLDKHTTVSGLVFNRSYPPRTLLARPSAPTLTIATATPISKDLVR